LGLHKALKTPLSQGRASVLTTPLRAAIAIIRIEMIDFIFINKFITLNYI